MTSIIEEELLKFLVSRKNILEGICITGGEATLNGIELINLVDKIREQMGENFSIKLDTNGTNPKFLEKYLEKFDYIAMDFKTLYYEKYLNCSEQNILESLNVLKKGKVPYIIMLAIIF
jgi:pyruvate formate lyase activating enzyme